MESRTIAVKHLVIKLDTSFEQFTRILEGALGRLNHEVFTKMENDPALVAAALATMGGYEDLILFDIYEHGKLLNIAEAPRKAKQYVIGNPGIASTMTRLDIRAALYAPLHVLVYEQPDKVSFVEYDLPSSLFGQFGNAEVTRVGESLDTKFERLIRKADTDLKTK